MNRRYYGHAAVGGFDVMTSCTVQQCCSSVQWCVVSSQAEVVVALCRHGRNLECYTEL